VILEPRVSAPQTLAQAAAIVCLGLLGSGVAQLVYFRLIAHWGSTRTSVYAYFTPLVGVGVGVVVLREEVTILAGAGCLLVIAGVAMTRWSRRSPTRMGIRSSNTRLDGESC
jgi:drug/metabolite transporter (DMT)-like permease